MAKVTQSQFKSVLGKSLGMTKVPTTPSYNNLAGAFGSLLTPVQTNTASSKPTPTDVRNLIASYGKGGQTSVPFYPTPTGAPIPQPVTLSAGSKSSSGSTPSVLGVSYIPTYSTPTTITASGMRSSDSSSSLMSLPSVSSYTASSSPGTASFDMSSLLTPAMASYGYSIKDGQLVPPTEEAPEEVSLVDKYAEKIKSFLPKPESKLDTYKKLQKEAEIKEKQNLVNSLTSQLNNIVATRDAQLESLRQTGSTEGVTEAVYGGQQLQLNREAAIKALPVAAQLTAAQNDLETARSYVDTYFKIYSDDVDAKQKYTTDLYKTAFQYANEEQKQKLSELATRKSNEFTLKRDAINNAQALANTALENGQKSLFAQITALNPDDPNYTQKIAQLGSQVSAKQTESEKDRATVSSIASQLQSSVGSDGFTDPNLYARLRATSGISASDFDNRFGYLVNPASYSRLGLSQTKEVYLTGEQLKQKINAQIATQDFKDLSKQDKKDYILSQGGDPADFGY